MKQLPNNDHDHDKFYEENDSYRDPMKVDVNNGKLKNKKQSKEDIFREHR